MDQVQVPTTAVPKYASRTVARGKIEIGQREKVIGCVAWYVISSAPNVEGAELTHQCAIVNYATRLKCFKCNAPRPGASPFLPLQPPLGY
jgi:hypothetical protein